MAQRLCSMPSSHLHLYRFPSWPASSTPPRQRTSFSCCGCCGWSAWAACCRGLTAPTRGECYRARWPASSSRQRCLGSGARRALLTDTTTGSARNSVLSLCLCRSWSYLLFSQCWCGTKPADGLDQRGSADMRPFCLLPPWRSPAAPYSTSNSGPGADQPPGLPIRVDRED